MKYIEAFKFLIIFLGTVILLYLLTNHNYEIFVSGIEMVRMGNISQGAHTIFNSLILTFVEWIAVIYVEWKLI